MSDQALSDQRDGYDFAVSHPAICDWLKGLAELPGFKPAYELLPGRRLTYYASTL
jgi:glutathione S-transferase